MVVSLETSIKRRFCNMYCVVTRGITVIFIVVVTIACSPEKEFALAEKDRLETRDKWIAVVQEERAARRAENLLQYKDYTDAEYIDAGKQHILAISKSASFRDVEVKRKDGVRQLCGWVKSKGLFGGYTEFSVFVWIDGVLHMRRTRGSMGDALDFVNALNGCR